MSSQTMAKRILITDYVVHLQKAMKQHTFFLVLRISMMVDNHNCVCGGTYCEGEIKHFTAFGAELHRKSHLCLVWRHIVFVSVRPNVLPYSLERIQITHELQGFLTLLVRTPSNNTTTTHSPQHPLHYTLTALDPLLPPTFPSTKKYPPIPPHPTPPYSTPPRPPPRPLPLPGLNEVGQHHRFDV